MFHFSSSNSEIQKDLIDGKYKMGKYSFISSLKFLLGRANLTKFVECWHASIFVHTITIGFFIKWFQTVPAQEVLNTFILKSRMI